MPHDYRKGSSSWICTPLSSISRFFWGDSYSANTWNGLSKEVAHELTTFNEENSSLGTMLGTSITVTVGQIPSYFLLTKLHERMVIRRSLIIICALGMFFILLAVWFNFYYHYMLRRSNNTNSALKDKGRRMIPVLQTYASLAIIITYSIRLFLRVTSAPCHDDDVSERSQVSWGDNWDCNPYDNLDTIPEETMYALMLFPILLAVTLKEVSLKVMMICWSGAVCSLIAATVYKHAYRSLSLVLVYILPSLIIIFENKRHNFALFLLARELKMMLKEKDENADQVHAAEMRHMIANVAHDLKTPLTSFLSGIELISDIALECQNHISENSMSPVQLHDNVISILNCLANIRNTNSFMLMTINRCIDYTKASKGLKLVPKYETIDLMETLSLPLNCMKDIQQRVSIVLEPLSRDICSHVITDKQWLQENVLCLLSNAVKYSSEGEVKVMLRLINGDEDSVKMSRFRNVLGNVSFNKWKPKLSIVPVNDDERISGEDDSSVVSRFRVDTGESDGKHGAECSDHIQSSPISSFLCIEIEDNGIGLSEEAMGNLFNPFKQAQRLAGGTGLGLYSLARRLEALNGQYGVSNRRDGEQGCMFWFSIPYRPDSVSAESTHKSIFPRRQGTMSRITGSTDITPAVSPSRSSMDGRFPRNNKTRKVDPESEVLDEVVLFTELSKPNSATVSVCKLHDVEDDVSMDILLVDDSPAIVKMTSMMLKRLGHRITCAENGDVALKKIWEKLESSKRPFDVVLMDLQMPVMDGLEATRRLRSGEASKRILSNSNIEGINSVHQLVIGVSANSDYETMQDALDAGADAFMSKPFSIETFYDTYEKLKDSLLRT